MSLLMFLCFPPPSIPSSDHNGLGVSNFIFSLRLQPHFDNAHRQRGHLSRGQSPYGCSGCCLFGAGRACCHVHLHLRAGVEIDMVGDKKTGYLRPLC